MSDKGFVGLDKMCVEFVNNAKGMSDFILESTFKGPGDTVDAAMHRAERMYGAPATWMRRLRYRSIRDMPVSAYAAIVRAYNAALEASEKNYLAERELAHARGSKILGVADFVAGSKTEPLAGEVPPLLAAIDAAREADQKNTVQIGEGG